MRNDSVFYAHIQVQLDCLIWGRKPSVSILQIIYIIDFQTSLKETGIYHPNCGRRSVCHCHFIKIMVNGTRFFSPAFSQISFNLYIQLHSPSRPNSGKGCLCLEQGGNFACLVIIPGLSQQSPTTLHSAPRNLIQEGITKKLSTRAGPLKSSIP